MLVIQVDPKWSHISGDLPRVAGNYPELEETRSGFS